MKRRMLWGTFAAYCLVMLWLLFGQRMGAAGDASLNLVPFDTVSRFLWVLQNSNQPGMITHAVVNLAGNVVMFVPLGLLLPAIWRHLRRFWRCLSAVSGVILAIEITQLLTRLGACDVDDFILNLAGALLGYLLWLLVRERD